MAELQETELRHLIKSGETTTVELKAAVPRHVEMAERMCGMANAQGGIIIIGVEDSEHKIVGVPDERMATTMDTILRAARINIKPSLVLRPQEPDVYILDGLNVIVVTIPPSGGPVYQSGGVCWVRRGTHTIPLSVMEMLELSNDLGLQDWELQPAYGSSLDDLDMERVNSYLKLRLARSRQGGRFEDVEKALIGMRCAVAMDDGKVTPTNVGLLFFGRYPQLQLIQCEVVCVLFRETIGASRYADRKIIIGPLQELIDEAEAFLNRYIAVGAHIEGWMRVDIPEYAIEVLREAIVNAVVHRDYSKRGESIRVFYYPDRIEIHSPGLLLPGITIELMERGEVPSKLRNPILANLLRDIPGYMERIGSGIRFMVNETQRLGLPKPQFRESSEFVVVFPKATALVTNPTIPEQAEMPWIHQEESNKRVSAAPNVQEDRLTKVVQYVHAYGSITNSQHRELTGVSDRTATRDLETLVERGRLRGIGKRRSRRYELP